MFVVVSNFWDAVSDEEPNPTAVVVDDEFVPKGNINVLLVPNWFVTKLVVLDVVPAISEGIPSDKAPEEPNPAAVGVDDVDEMTSREDVLMLPNCSVTKLLVLELVSSFKLELMLKLEVVAKLEMILTLLLLLLYGQSSESFCSGIGFRSVPFQ